MQHFYLYVKPDGHPDVSNYSLPLHHFPGYQFMGKFDTMPAVLGKRYVSGQWVRADQVPEYAVARKASYPPIGDQLDALWKALGPTLDNPEAVAMLAKIQAVKAAHPKPSN